MVKKENLIIIPNERFGKLIVIREVAPTVKLDRGYNCNIRNVECLCDCGNTVILQYSTLKKTLKRGSVSSCGCQKIKTTNLIGYELDETLSILPIQEKKDIIKTMILDGCNNVQIGNKLSVNSSLISKIRNEMGMNFFKIDKESQIGKKFNLLTITGIDEKKSKYRKFICKCDCGTEDVLVRYNHLKNGNVKSCGCLNKRMAKEMMINKIIPKSIIHGDSKKESQHHYLYQIWLSSKQRCYNPKNKRYSTYGKLGITMYVEWVNNYPLFKEYMITNLGEKPTGKTNSKVDSYSIDRIDVTKGYEPGNLRWATFVEQANNKHKSI